MVNTPERLIAEEAGTFLSILFPRVFLFLKRGDVAEELSGTA